MTKTPIDLHLVETALSSEQVFAGRLLDVRRDIVRLPNGESSVREYIVHPGAVVILPLLPNGNLLFERQFRYPVGQVCLELPAGKIDPGEPILNTGRRELREETGYIAQSWTYLGVMHPCIGYANERIEIFLASQMVLEGPPRLDDNEFLELIELSPTQARDKVLAGEITDAKTITALYWLAFWQPPVE